MRRLVLHTAIIGVSAVLAGMPARAANLTGTWITDTENCGKVFSIRGGKSSFRRDSDMFGSGFIIDGRRIRGRMASCTISKTQEKDGVVNMLASCATDVMLQNVQFSVRAPDDNTIVRIFPGIEGMELTYHRCPAAPAALR